MLLILGVVPGSRGILFFSAVSQVKENGVHISCL